MACKSIAKMCKHLIPEQALTYTASTATEAANLAIEIPDGSYRNGEKYCLLILDELPAGTTVDAQVVINIGTSDTAIPLVDKCGRQLTARAIRRRTKYSTKVITSATGGVFKLIGNICEGCRAESLEALDADT